METAPKPVNRIAVAAVSAYLLMVGVWLILSRQIPSPGIRRILRAKLRRPFHGTLVDFQPEQGYCYLSRLPAALLSDRESFSCLQAFENDQPLGPPHAPHDDVRQMGGGRFSHWGDQLFFSTSDNSDPRINGRRYSVKEVRR